MQHNEFGNGSRPDCLLPQPPTPVCQIYSISLPTLQSPTLAPCHRTCPSAVCLNIPAQHRLALPAITTRQPSLLRETATSLPHPSPSLLTPIQLHLHPHPPTPTCTQPVPAARLTPIRQSRTPAAQARLPQPCTQHEHDLDVLYARDNERSEHSISILPNATQCPNPIKFALCLAMNRLRTFANATHATAPLAGITRCAGKARSALL